MATGFLRQLLEKKVYNIVNLYLIYKQNYTPKKVVVVADAKFGPLKNSWTLD